MTAGTFRGVVRGGKVVLLENEGLPADGTEVLVTPVPTSQGTVAAVLAAAAAPPPVPTEWVDELEQLIAAGRRPPTRNNPFADEIGNPESS